MSNFFLGPIVVSAANKTLSASANETWTRHKKHTHIYRYTYISIDSYMCGGSTIVRGSLRLP